MFKLNVYPFLILSILFIVFSCNTNKHIFQENTKNWSIIGNATWKFSNKEFTGNVTNGEGYIFTKKSYKNFELQLEFKPDSTINSGVFIRCNKEIKPTNCYELNIWDLHPNQEYRTGSIVLKNKPLAFVETINKWNSLKFKVAKNHLQV